MRPYTTRTSNIHISHTHTSRLDSIAIASTNEVNMRNSVEHNFIGTLRLLLGYIVDCAHCCTDYRHIPTRFFLSFLSCDFLSRVYSPASPSPSSYSYVECAIYSLLTNTSSVYFIYEVVRPCRFASTICIYDMMWHVCINVRFFLLFFIVTFDGTTPSTTATTGNSAKMWTFRRQRNNGTSSHFFVYCLTWIFARSILIKMSVILAPRARAIERSITLSFFLSSEMSSMRDSKFCINIFIGLS